MKIITFSSYFPYSSHRSKDNLLWEERIIRPDHYVHEATPVFIEHDIPTVMVAEPLSLPRWFISTVCFVHETGLSRGICRILLPSEFPGRVVKRRFNRIAKIPRVPRVYPLQLNYESYGHALQYSTIPAKWKHEITVIIKWLHVGYVITLVNPGNKTNNDYQFRFRFAHKHEIYFPN